ncbi:competence type IV pilus minor pilin ComGF [Texcoconibacillus texcoconensis]|uniref:Competence protein ComGF n=1 Tax=Texcoconibacillus texcoconensis TaxID=1095777 RepID=A0A840QP07_9BACI|nr:competence type IV pilus minor pilin ComGF [Texcoconibacillus texcoconensis]MBB5173104.1 competence protein ComGF [Texcoconibacillus texcoconensis]
MDACMSRVKLHTPQGRQEGVTLVEMLVTMSIFLIITSLIPLFFNSLTAIPKQADARENAALFFQEIHVDLRFSVEHSTSSTQNELFIEDKRGRQISFHLFKDRIRRQVGGAGQEMVLLGVQSFQVREVSDGIDMTVTFETGETFSRRFRHVASKGGSQ